MELEDAIHLIAPATPRFERLGAWADLGCGQGLFTKALAGVLPRGSVIYAVDTDRPKLNRLEPFEQVSLHKIAADFIHDPLPLADLDGILMANSLHFVSDKQAFLDKASQWLTPDGCFLFVEYDTDKPDPWVPYPLSYVSATALFDQSRYRITNLGSRPSIYKRSGIYAALVERCP